LNRQDTTYYHVLIFVCGGFCVRPVVFSKQGRSYDEGNFRRTRGEEIASKGVLSDPTHVVYEVAWWGLFGGILLSISILPIGMPHIAVPHSLDTLWNKDGLIPDDP